MSRRRCRRSTETASEQLARAFLSGSRRRKTKKRRNDGLQRRGRPHTLTVSRGSSGAWIQVFLEEKKHVKVLNKVWLKPQTNALVTEDVCSQTGRLSDGLWGSVQLTVSDILHHRCCSCYWISFYCVQYCKYELGLQVWRCLSQWVESSFKITAKVFSFTINRHCSKLKEHWKRSHNPQNDG